MTAGQKGRAGGWGRWLALAWAPTVLAVALVPLAARRTGHPVSLFTRDVFSAAEAPVYTGLLSNLGVFLWCSSAALGLFTGALVARSRGARTYYLGFGALSAAFLLDDFFMLHEWVVPKVFGLPESAVSAAYAVALAGLVAATRRQVAAREPALLGVAVAWFAISVLLDVVERVPAPAWHYLAEEGCKILGIVTWTVYLARACAREARGEARPWTP